MRKSIAEEREDRWREQWAHNEIRYLHPDRWTGEHGRRHREAEAQARHAHEAYVLATTHRIDERTRRCSVCGVSELAIEATAPGEHLPVCVPDLVVGGAR